MDQQVIELQLADTPESAAGKLKLQPESIILLLGDFEAGLQPQIRSILSRSVAPLALESKTLIVDDGAPSGSAAAMGLAGRDQDKPPMMVAIVARDVTAIDPNHALAIRLPAEWTDSGKSISQIAAQLAIPPAAVAPAATVTTPGSNVTSRVAPAAPPVVPLVAVEPERPVLAILSGGGDVDLPALIQCARRGWPIIAIAGSGGLADELVEAAKPPAKPDDPKPQLSPALTEILEAGIGQFPIDGPIISLQRILVAHLETRVQTLPDAWARYDDLDLAAVVKQASFRNMQLATISLGVAATFLVVSQTSGALPDWFKGLFPDSLKATPGHLATFAQAIHILIIVTPILISILVAANNRFREGSKWILLRSAAESVKSEIFRYRAQAGPYSTQQTGEVSAEALLAGKIKDITSSLVQSEVNKTRLERIPRDDPQFFKKFKGKDREKEQDKVRGEMQHRNRFLSPEEYVTYRLDNQIDFMLKKTAKLDVQLNRTQWEIYIVGGVGTLLAAVKIDVWVALTTALATALTTRQESEQVESSLVQYNQALIALQNIRTWWKALTKWEKARQTNINLLVEQTEQTMEFELKGWAQQMQSALDKLTEKEAGATAQAKAQSA